MHNKNILWH